MSNIITVVSEDSVEFQVDLTIVPNKSALYCILTDNNFRYEKDQQGRLILSFPADELKSLLDYLKYGYSKPVDHLYDILDYYNIPCIYPRSIFDIKLAEDYYRNNLYCDHKDCDLDDQEYGLIELTESLFNEFDLMKNVRWIYTLGISVYRQVGERTDSVCMDRVDFPNESIRDESLKCDSVKVASGMSSVLVRSGFPLDDTTVNRFTFGSHMTYDPITAHIINVIKTTYTEKIHEASEKFKERDRIFGVNNIIRECNVRTRSAGGGAFKKINNEDDMTNHLSLERTYEQFSNYIEMLQVIIGDWSNVVVAGGSLVRALIGAKDSDIDVFIYGLNVDQANEKLKKIISRFSSINNGAKPYQKHSRKAQLLKRLGRLAEISRSENSVTFKFCFPIQIILRLYKTKSEIIHGFDLPSCGILYDGSKVLMTKSCEFSLRHMMNWVDFDRTSLSYEYRLHKYQRLGFAVFIPEFDKRMIKTHMIREIFEYRTSKDNRIKTDNSRGMYDISPYKLKGIDKLIYGYHYGLFKNYEQSDYSNVGSNRLIFGSNENVYSDISGYPRSDKFVLTSYTVKNSVDHLFDLYVDRLKEEIKSFIKSSKKLHYGGRGYSEKLSKKYDREFEIAIPMKLTWKTINPGEQATGTFHKLVYKDRSLWYNQLTYSG